MFPSIPKGEIIGNMSNKLDKVMVFIYGNIFFFVDYPHSIAEDNCLRIRLCYSSRIVLMITKYSLGIFYCAIE